MTLLQTSTAAQAKQKAGCNRDNLIELERRRQLLLDTHEAEVIRSIAVPMIDKAIKLERKALGVVK